ncbi:MAG: type II secretion system protein [Pseudomonadota bacterium]
MRRRLHNQTGITLIELVIAIVVTAIAVGTVLARFANTTGASADPMVRRQAVAIAESYLEEITVKPVDDPDGIDGEATRPLFDDVDDYDGLSDAGARDQFNVAIAGLDAYAVTVAVSASGALPGVAAGDALRVDVRVARAPDIDITLSSYRLRY